MLKIRCFLLIALFCLVSSTAIAEEGISGKVVSESPAADNTGLALTLPADYQASFNEGVSAIKKKDVALATLDLDRVYLYFNQQMTNNNALYLSFAGTDEYQSYLQEYAPTKEVVWCDPVFEKLLYYKAYLLTDNKLFDLGLKSLDEAIQHAPYASELYVERGYSLDNLALTPEALASYNYAINLTDRFINQRGNKAWALRGKGYCLTDMGDLAGAKAAYNESLELSPGNETALGELDYINKLENNPTNAK